MRAMVRFRRWMAWRVVLAFMRSSGTVFQWNKGMPRILPHRGHHGFFERGQGSAEKVVRGFDPDDLFGLRDPRPQLLQFRPRPVFIVGALQKDFARGAGPQVRSVAQAGGKARGQKEARAVLFASQPGDDARAEGKTDTSPRSVMVEHPVRRGYELRSVLRPEEITADWMRFRLHVEPKQTASLVVVEARPVETTYQLTNINAQEVDLLVRQQSIDKTLEEALRKVLAQKSAISELEG